MKQELKLLLLEDDPADAAFIQKLLQRSGMRFIARIASDEKEFLQALEDNGFDAVLADNALPQYSSMEALTLLKQKNPFVAFILVTGTVSEEFAVNIIQEGADDYILKTNLTRLPAAINKAVENKTMQKEKLAAAKEMQELNDQLRSLTAHLNNIREEEQTRIAREIHDELGQMLTSIKINISTADKKIGRSIADAKGFLSQALEIVDNTIKTVRRIASELRPSILDDLGLVAALEWQSQEFQKRSDIKCNFTNSVPEMGIIDKNTATGFYRIFQEALTNIARHAEASLITATFSIIENNLVFVVQDNGKGFDMETVKKKKSLGLIGMKERALMMKGQLTLESYPNKGTTITVKVPVPGELQKK